MYLKAIELHGFKSFPDKTKIEFEKGMSAVVGPNGSGKSNISDAIKWVLGETRGSQLRSGGKMEDIIFGGTQKRNPMGFASVSLILDNSGHTFDVDAREVAVTRKYYRGGESEYYINGARVRLRDIQELFFDTGLGKNGYSIVSQGKVSEIVTAKPEGRREIFEEASGIAKFRYKKNEAERKLESAEGNITRLTDILSQLEERVGPLERESKKAKEFIELSAQKKELEISLWLDTIEKSKENIRSAQRRLEIFTEDYNTVSEKLKETEDYIEKRYLYGNSLIAKNEDNISLIRSYEGQISRIASQKAVLENQNRYSVRQLENLKKEMESYADDSRQTRKAKAELEEKIRSLSRQIEEKLTRQAQLQMQLEEIAKKARQAGDEKGRLTRQISDRQLSIQQTKIDISSNESRMAALEENIRTAKVNLEKAAEYLEQRRRQAKDLEEFIARADESILKNGNIKNGLLMKSRSAREKTEQAKKAIEENLMAQRQTADRIRILTDLENNMDGFSQSVKTVLKKAAEGGLGGILGSVAQLITVEKKYETAVEIALGYAMQNIVTQNETSAKNAIEFLKKTRGGRATFLPLDTVRPSNFNEKLPRWAVTADKVIKTEERYKNIVSNLLGRTIIVSDIDSASLLAKNLGYRYRIVTLDGQIINAGGSFTGGSVSRTAGIFSRRGEIENLQARLENLKGQMPQLEKDRNRATQASDLVNSQIAGCVREIDGLSADKAEASINLAQVKGSMAQYQSRIDSLKADESYAEKTLEECRQKNLDLQHRVQVLAQEERSLSRQLETLGRADRQAVENTAALSEQIQALRLESANLNGQLNLEQNNLAVLEGSMAQRERRKRQMSRDINRAQSQMEQRQQSLQRLEEQEKNLKELIVQKERENQSFVQQRMEIERERNTLTADNRDLMNKKEELSGQIAKIGERISAMEISYDGIIAKLWEEYELTVQSAAEFAKPIEDESGMKRQLASLRNSIKRLGSVNVGAIEEYKEVSQRYNYLKDQLEDLNQSKNRLIKLITSLNGEMKTMFSESFAVINENFGRIFTELFGGGSAKLELTDKEDVLSSGIEILVSPPGKVIKSLTALSGGEQALVAISIYFAILAHNPAPFCILDEIEAALDDVNVTRYANYLHRICDKTQFIVITHRRGTMEAADVLYGVTMQEDGISKLLKLDVNNLSPAILN